MSATHAEPALRSDLPSTTDRRTLHNALVEDEELLTVPEVARELRVSLNTVRRWIEQGDLAGHRLHPDVDGSHRRIPRSAVDALKAKRKARQDEADKRVDGGGI